PRVLRPPRPGRTEGPRATATVHRRGSRAGGRRRTGGWIEFSASYNPPLRLKESTGVGDHCGLIPSARLTGRGEGCNDEAAGEAANGRRPCASRSVRFELADSAH